MSVFTTPFGSLKLDRLPVRRKETLQAWDAADEYLLEFLHQENLSPDTKVLVCNDAFGALSLGLGSYTPAHYSDSFMSEQAVSHNARQNDIPDTAINFIPSTGTPSGSWDIVVIKLPKNQSWFKEQLLQIKPYLHENSRVVVAAMVKHLPHSALEQMDQIIGPATLSRAKKKARLLFATPDSGKKLPVSAYPKKWKADSTGITLVNHANVFSRDSLDIGGRFFMQHLPQGLSGNIIDLGCGNGVIGIAAARQNDAHITFVDESYMAVASAQEGWALNINEPERATFRVNDGLKGFEPASADCVLCNPPFHQSNTVGDHIAVGMFREAHKVLKPGGEFRVIGNRHLGYHVKLKKLFGNCKVLTQNAKFVILSCTR
ncbi:methyltransferase [Endozoicomonadaceae bacterium StTr2]